MGTMQRKTKTNVLRQLIMVWGGIRTFGRTNLWTDEVKKKERKKFRKRCEIIEEYATL